MDDVDDFILPEDVDEGNSYKFLEKTNSDGDETTASTEIEQDLHGKQMGKITAGHCAKAMDNTIRKYGEVKQRIAEIDCLAMQLSYGVRLLAEMDKCATERRNFPLHIELKKQGLSSGASLLIIKLRNTSPFEFIEWHLILIASSLQSTTNGKIFTFVLPIKRLLKYSEFTHEVFCTVKLAVPLVFRTQFLKCIHLSENSKPRAFRIGLEAIYFTNWDRVTITATPNITSSRPILYERVNEEQKLTLPEALVYLLCDGKPTEASLLNWITGTFDDKCQSVSCMVQDDVDSVRGLFSIQIKRKGMNYDIILKMRDSSLRNALINDLLLRILIRMQYIWKEMKAKEDCELLMDISSLSKCFASFVVRYSP